MALRGRTDAVDRVVAQWNAVRPDLDISPVAVIGRISRLSRLIDRRLAQNFAAHDLEAWMYDVLATLYRQGPPHRLMAGELVGQTMVTTGAITNRIDRLTERGFVRRVGDPHDRRKVIVELTPEGIQKVESTAESHLATEAAILSPLADADLHRLADQLRTLLLALGDGTT